MPNVAELEASHLNRISMPFKCIELAVNEKLKLFALKSTYFDWISIVNYIYMYIGTHL